MNNREKYNNVFVEALEISADKVDSSLEMGKNLQWDSVGHMNLIAHLEETFNIEFEMEDMMMFNSYNAGIEILSKYGIKID